MKFPIVIQSALPLALSNVFVTFAVMYLHRPLKLDYLGASLCIMGAVFFIFRG